MIDVVDRAYLFTHTLFDENTGGQILSRLAERDLPLWNKPALARTTQKPKIAASPDDRVHGSH
jgi:hypothetical protein